MKLYPGLTTMCITAMLTCSCTRNTAPICQHPQNPHYFLFRGKPAILIGSTEHYGAVLNLDFDYIAYLNELSLHHLNVTRTFSGIYVEPQGAFGIEKNTLAPSYGKFICPWARSNQSGYKNGGNKFDLEKWDEAYFTRLKDFISEAGKRNIVVELDLFSNFYDTLQWRLCPLYIRNNINNIGDIADHKEILSLRHREILDIQEKMVRKIVLELKDFDNLYYEVCNEPYFGDLLALEAWEQHMTGIIADAEKDFHFRHMISQNIANGSEKVINVNPLVSILNFHYARPPLAIEANYGTNRIIGDNETGFDGTQDSSYRKEAWNFILAGGGLFDNLDYSFTIDQENGSFLFPSTQPGGGGSQLRKQLGILKDVMDEVDFMHMKAADSIVKNDSVECRARVLAMDRRLYLIYLCRAGQKQESCSISPGLPEGNYTGEWIDTRTGERTKIGTIRHSGGILKLTTPDFKEDIALKLVISGSN